MCFEGDQPSFKANTIPTNRELCFDLSIRPIKAAIYNEISHGDIFKYLTEFVHSLIGQSAIMILSFWDS